MSLSLALSSMIASSRKTDISSSLSGVTQGVKPTKYEDVGSTP
jgi:hypothetical protein